MCFSISVVSAAQYSASPALPLGGSYGSIIGTVQTDDGLALAGVHVQLQNLAQGTTLTATSDSHGLFRFDEISAGTYLITATLGVQSVPQHVVVASGPAIVDLRFPEKKRIGNKTESTVSSAQLKIPKQARNEFHKALAAMAKQKTPNVERYLDKALELYPQYSEALAMRAVLQRESRPEEARQDAERAVEYDPNYAMGYVVLGSVYTQLGRFDNAINTLDRAIGMNPVAWQGYFEMSRALIGQRDFTSALRQIEKACRLAPKAYPVLRLAKADIFMGLSNNPAAVGELEAYLREEPNGQKSLEIRRTLEKLQAVSSNN